MNGNELASILVAIVGIPICLWALIKMPNARNCSSCGTPLNMNRQVTYHATIHGEDKEICMKCHTMRTKPSYPEISSSRQASPACTPNAKVSVTVNPKKASETSQKQYQIDSTNDVIGKVQLGESILINEVLEEIKDNNCFWLDTETTGLSSSDEIIEISICTHDKKVVFDSILSSKVTCSEQARGVHCISDEQIANGMPIESAKATLLELLEGKTIISFNADFDCQMLYQTIGLTTKKRFCVMKWSQTVLDYERWPRLEKVCERLNIKQSEVHRSLADTVTTIDLFNKLVDLTSNHKYLLRDFALINLNAIDELEEGETLFLAPNSNIITFDWLIDRYGNRTIGIRSKALKRMLKKEGTRIFVKRSRKGKTLKVQYIDEPDFQLPISMEELSNRLGALKLKNINPNRYLDLKATIISSSINKTTNDVIDGTYYFPSIVINAKIYEELENLPIFHNSNRESIAFTITSPKNTLKKMFALGLQGYSSILKVVEHEETINITAYHLLDAQKITLLNSWDVDGEKAWSGDY